MNNAVNTQTETWPTRVACKNLGVADGCKIKAESVQALTVRTVQSGAYERCGGQGQMVRMVRTRVVGVCAPGRVDRNGSGRPELCEVIHPG